MRFNYDLHCCGLMEIDGINAGFTSSAATMKSILTRGYGRGAIVIPHASHVIFTQASGSKSKKGYGFRLAEYIEENSLGSVVCSKPSTNPNTGNYIFVFTWVPSKKGIANWARNQKMTLDNY